MAIQSNIVRSVPALLSSIGEVTSFCHGDQYIRFRTSPKLERYISVKEWDHGYMVVVAKYRGMGEVEDYIDLIPILRNLYIDEELFLNPIKSVEVCYNENQ